MLSLAFQQLRNHRSNCHSMLVLAALGLIFFPAARMGLCFGFVLETALIPEGWFRYCGAVLTQSQGLSCSSPHPTRSWEGTQPGQLTPTDPRGVPAHMASCSAHRAGGEGGRGGCWERWRLSSQVTVRCDGARLCWGWLSTCLPLARAEWIPWVALPACTALALPIKLSLSQPTSFLTFTLPISSPVPPVGSE